MQVLLGLRDFGKIKSAEVDIGGFPVFVGKIIVEKPILCS